MRYLESFSLPFILLFEIGLIYCNKDKEIEMTENEVMPIENESAVEMVFVPEGAKIVQITCGTNSQECTKQEKLLIQKARLDGYTYETCTEFIRENINTAMEVAQNLHIVLKYKLYRLHYNTFEEYVSGEFNYTRGRAYQLTRAHELATKINNDLGKDVLTTEAQCRELLRLKMYQHDTRKEDKDQTHKCRLELINKILKDSDVLKATAIAKGVDDIFAENNAKEPRVEAGKKRIQKSLSAAQKKIKSIFESDLSKAEKNTIISAAKKEIGEIQKLIKTQQK